MESNLSILTELIKMARIDKNEHEDEYMFMKFIARSMNVSDEEFDALFSEYADFEPPKMEMARIVQFQRLVLVANVDYHVDSDELLALRRAGMKLGLSPVAVNTVINEMKLHDRGVIPEDRLREIFFIYHN